MSDTLVVVFATQPIERPDKTRSVLVRLAIRLTVMQLGLLLGAGLVVVMLGRGSSCEVDGCLLMSPTTVVALWAFLVAIAIGDALVTTLFHRQLRGMAEQRDGRERMLLIVGLAPCIAGSALVAATYFGFTIAGLLIAGTAILATPMAVARSLVSLIGCTDQALPEASGPMRR